MPEPALTVTASVGVARVIVSFDRGDEDAGFALLKRTLPAIRDLDRRSRRTSAEPSDHTRAK
jgi:hypothetical protein